MKQSSWLVLPFLLQGLAMMVDEFYFHFKRGLPKWERVGHPLDTLSVLACYGFLTFLPPTELNILFYTGLCIFSCVFVTKDEFEHKKHCGAGEQWLHALLFTLHPVVFMVAGWIWVQAAEGSTTSMLNPVLLLALKTQIYLTLGFLVFQITYWNFIWKSDQV